MCLIPSDEASVEAQLQEFHIAAKARHRKVVPRPLVSALDEVLGDWCFYISSGGTLKYELCYGDFVRQIHVSGKRVSSVVLGRAYPRESAFPTSSPSHQPQQDDHRNLNKWNRHAEEDVGISSIQREIREGERSYQSDDNTGDFSQEENKRSEVNSRLSRKTTNPRVSSTTVIPPTKDEYDDDEDHHTEDEEDSVEREYENERREDGGEASVARFGHDHRGAYISTIYANGDGCSSGVNPDDRRITEVRVYCSNGYQGRRGMVSLPSHSDSVMDLFKVGTCKYVLTLHVEEACAYEELREPSVERDVVCYPL